MLNECRLTDEQRELVRSNLKLAHGAVKQFNARERLGHFLEFDDIVQIACLALCKAAARHNSQRGKFSTYAYNVIKNAFTDEIKKHSRRTRLVKMVGYDELAAETITACGHIDESSIDVCRAMSGLSTRCPDGNSADIAMFKLRLEGYDTEEIAEIFGFSKDKVRRRINKVKNGLRKNNAFLQEAGVVQNRFQFERL